MPQRRRGEELTDALLKAAWDILSEQGYGAFSMDAVAARAGTSKPVYYRRWGDKSALLHATLEYAVARQPVTVPDTGSLRSDVLAAMRLVNETGLELAAVISVRLADYYQETGTSPSELHDVVAAGSVGAFAEVFERGIARGELDPARLTPRIRSLPFDLLRGELINSLRPASESVLVEIVDEIFLPLVKVE